jgi:myo-inositol 2-dehydrogenase/D-chiro-inositol 1-dehydrogenase
MPSSRLRLGIFGVGRMGLVHLENLVRLAKTGQIEFVALGDRRAETRAAALAAAERCGLASELACFETSEAMAEAGQLDAAVVASRTEHHAGDTLALASRGVAVLVEKPLANSVLEAVEFSRAAARQGTAAVQVAFQRYYDAASRLARQWVAAGRIGELQQTHHVLQDKNPTPPAYQSPGITADMAIHLVFEALSFHRFELPRSVQALQFLAPHYEDRAGEGANVVHAFLQWADGSVAHLWGSRINDTGYDNGFKLIGTLGRIDVGEFVGDFGPIEARLWQGTGRTPGERGRLAERRRFRMKRPEPIHPDFYARFARAYERELRVFLRAVAAGRPFELGLEIGWKTLLVANAAEASSRAGGRRYELCTKHGEPIRTPDDAAEFADREAVV